VEQENAIELLILGKTDREVAEAVGVARQTVTEWRNKNAVFEAELNRRRRELWSGYADALRALVRRALEVLAEDLENERDLRLRQSAAVHVLRAVGMYGLEAPGGPVSASAVEVGKIFNDLIG